MSERPAAGAHPQRNPAQGAVEDEVVIGDGREMPVLSPHSVDDGRGRMVDQNFDVTQLSRQMAAMASMMHDVQQQLIASRQENQQGRNTLAALERKVAEMSVSDSRSYADGRSLTNTPLMTGDTSSAASLPSGNSGQQCRSDSVRSTSVAATLTHKPFDLPHFSGAPEQWPVFIAAFRQSTEEFGYTPLQNIFRLQKCLKDEARERVEYLLLNPEKVNELMAALEFEFGRPEILAQSQRERLRRFKDIPEGRIDLLIPYSSLVQNLVAFLDSKDNRHMLTETTLLADLVCKLPANQQLEWVQHSILFQPRPNAYQFSEWLCKIAKCASILKSQTLTANSQQQTANTGTNQVNKRSTKHVLLNVSDAPQSQVCNVCSRQHKVADCQKFQALQVSERWTAARRLRLCFGCLKSGHSFDVCRGKRACPVDSCSLSHHELLHESDTAQAASGYRQPVAEAQPTQNNPGAERSTNPFNQTNRSQAPVLTCSEPPGELPLLFRILPVKLYGPNAEICTYALFDEGSSVTMLDADLAEGLGLDGPVSNLDVQWFGNDTASSERSQRVRLQISGQTQTRFDMCNVRTVRHLQLPVQSVSVSPSEPRHRHLRGLPIAEFNNATPRLLIGLQHSHLGVSTDTRTNPGGGPIAAKTKLGWIIYGQQSITPQTVLLCREQKKIDDRLDRIISEYYTTEHFGVKAPAGEMESFDDQRARIIMQTTTQQSGNRYQTGLLWCKDDILLPDSYEMASQRLASVERKMRRDPVYKRLYTQQIANYLERGYARMLTSEEAAVRTARTWHLPHFGVLNANKPGKLRLVFDAAAAVRGVSLNSVLLKGPDLNKPLASILFQFRMRRIGVCADIAEMFLQIEVQPEDRCAQRFLWRTVEGEPPAVFEMRVMMFGASCSPTCAQYVKNHNAELYRRDYPGAAKAITDSHYVDDFVACFESEEEAIAVSRDVVRIHSQGGFQLRGFVSNSPAVLQALGASVNGDNIDMQMDGEASEKILGMRWTPRQDEFYFEMRFDRVPPDVVAGLRRPSKREVLSAAMSIFDPFGFLADFVLEAKLIVQDLWKAKVTWDEPIPPAENDRWMMWCAEIPRIKTLRIPRCYSAHLMTSKDVQLHIFADASEQAFAAIAYWRIVFKGQCEVAFICAKTKCAPIKILSIPRLELQAAVLATRLLTTIRQAHDIHLSKVVMWTDSQTVRQWICSSHRRFPPFVAHRVAEVLESTDETQWRWLPTEHNVADDGTRRKTAPSFDPESRWLRGPAYLQMKETCWPTAPAANSEQANGDIPEEMQQRFVGAVATGKRFSFIDRFSNMNRLCRAIGWARRFAYNALSKPRGYPKRQGELSASEVTGATNCLCRIAQREEFAAEYAALADGQPINARSHIRSLMPYLDSDGLMRINGRTDAADAAYLSTGAQRPILLPRSHHFTQLIVHHRHCEMAHQFEDATICAVRKQYWVPSLRQLVRTVKTRCQTCKMQSVRPHPPVAGQLPVDRITPYVHPFRFTGLDYFGPVTVRIGRRHEKRWIALFSCLTTRAIHMEVASDLSTDACLVCIKNFCNLRGVPQRIRSDCGTNFIGADNEMRRTEDYIDSSEMQRELSVKGIEWVFNCPANPEAGGAWERMVQSTKRVLAITLKDSAPPVETLRSLVIEAANLINSRPLTHVPVSSAEMEPITPNHFLLGRMNSTTAPGEEDPSQLCSRKQWRVQQQMVRQFWRQWVNDYLPELTRRSKFYKEVGPLKDGDLVLICDQNLPRGDWTRGRVEKVNIGTDGRVRTAVVRTSGGLLRRPVSKLAILDVVMDAISDGDRMGPGMSPSGTAANGDLN